MKKKGLLFIISGPAGSGKGTIVKRVRELAEFDFSVSATTRSPRPGELEGVHYFFVGKQEFAESPRAKCSNMRSMWEITTARRKSRSKKHFPPEKT